MTLDPDKIAAGMRKAAGNATPGPWVCDKPAVDAVTGFRCGVAIASTYGRQMIYADPSGGSFPAADQRHIAASNPANVLAILADRDALKAGVLEQARLNGMGAERELALMARIVALEKAAGKNIQFSDEIVEKAAKVETDEKANN